MGCGGYAPVLAISYSKGRGLSLPPKVRLMFKLLSPQILDLPSNLREQPIVFNRESIACHLIEKEFVYDPKIPSETDLPHWLLVFLITTNLLYHFFNKPHFRNAESYFKVQMDARSLCQLAALLRNNHTAISVSPYRAYKS